MKIKFLRTVEAPQNYTHRLCDDVCSCSETRTENATFFIGDEEDVNEPGHEIDLSGLKYNIDYVITEYP